MTFDGVNYSFTLWLHLLVVLWGLYTSHCFVISEYLDEGMLIPKNTSVLIRRVPGRPRKPIVTAPVSEQEEYCLIPFMLYQIFFTCEIKDLCDHQMANIYLSCLLMFS